MLKANKLLLWIIYNNLGKVNMADCGANNLYDAFLIATRGNHKYCKCKNGHYGKTVNMYWDDWHCSYCLKQIKTK